MDPLTIHDYLVRTRARIFDRVRSLDADAWAREFPIGLGTLGAILTHVMISEWYYVQRMAGRDVPPYETWPIRQEHPPPPADLEAAWTAQADDTRAALATVADWNAPIEYAVTNEAGEREIVTAGAADLMTQLAFHEIHHRAQVLNILRHLGLPADDLDFNAFFPRRPAS